MCWEKDFVNFGIANFEGSTVRVYKNKFSYVTLSVGVSVNNVLWAGSELNVFLSNGKVRRYKNKFSYVTF